MAQPIYIRSWESFQSALADTLIGLEAWHFLLVRERAEPHRAVRCVLRDDRLQCEVGDGASLPADTQRTLRGSGWQPGLNRSLISEAMWPAPSAEYRRLAGAVVAFFRGGLGLDTPQALEMDEGSEDPVEREGAIGTPPDAGHDFSPRRLEQTVEYLFATEPDRAHEHEELYARSLQTNDLGLRQIEAGDRMAVLAAQDLARNEGGSVVAQTSGTDAGGQPGMRHVAAIVRDAEQRPVRLLLVEAVGPDCDPGRRLVDEPRRQWAARGTAPYLRWVLEHDPRLHTLFASDLGLSVGVIGGTVELDYRVVRVSAEGKVTSTRPPLDHFDVGTLRLGHRGAA